jgi:putative restriction endonuclease
MSTAPKPRRRTANPYRYGWRYEKVKLPNGRTDWEMVPLTEEDVLHPRLEDHVTQNDAHQDDCSYLKSVFEAQLVGDPNSLVLSDCLINWDVPGLRGHGPDCAVIFGVRDPRQRWDSFDVKKEGTRPELIVEVTSPATRRSDLGKKRTHYYRVRVPYYVIVDQLPRRWPRELRLLGYQRGRRGYERMPLSAEGRLWLEPVKLWLGIEDRRANCYDANGRRLENYLELHEARDAAEQRADAAEDRVRQLEEELRRLRGG